MEIKAVQKFVLMSPRKIRPVAFLVRKLKPTYAVEVLPHIGKRAGQPLKKVISAAIANAKQKGANASDLVFKEIQVSEGPRLKRWMAGARGRAKPYKRRMSHIQVVLMTKEVKQSKGVKTKGLVARVVESKIKGQKAKLDVKSKNGKK